MTIIATLSSTRQGEKENKRKVQTGESWAQKLASSGKTKEEMKELASSLALEVDTLMKDIRTLQNGLKQDSVDPPQNIDNAKRKLCNRHHFPRIGADNRLGYQCPKKDTGVVPVIFH